MQTTSLASRLRLTIGRLNRRLRQEAGHGLPPSQLSALVSVERFGPLTPSELADRERIQRPTATRLLARMEEDGLVVRTPDPRDGRSALITVTDAGQALLREVRHAKDVYLEHRLETLSADELATLEEAARILERMLDA